MPVRICWPMVVGIVHPNIGGWIGAYATARNIDPWYKSLNKPSWTPPNWVFGPVWTTLYCTLGYSSYLVWRDGGGFRGAAIPLSLYGTNLVLNWSWSALFFSYHNIKLAFYEVLLLCGSTVAMGAAFYKVNPLACYLNIPYLAWGSFATALCYVIYRDNPTPAVQAAREKKG